MKVSTTPRQCDIFVLWLVCVTGSFWPANAQERTRKPIDIDKELRAKVPQDRASSYYHYSLAKWFEEKGDITQAISEMRKAADANDKSASVRVELAGLLVKARNFREAIEECREAIRLDPKDPEGYWLLAYIYDNSRERVGGKESLQKAVKELETMREVAPEDERAYYALGRAYLELGETEKALQAYEKFQSLRPDSDAGYVAMAEYYQKKADKEKAVEYILKAIEIQPESVKSMMMLASLYSQTNRDKEAIPIYKKILKLTGDNPTVQRQLGSSLVDAGQFEDAIRILEPMVQAAPSDTAALTQLGRARLGARQIPKAIESFKAVLEQNPSDPEAEFYLGACYEQGGDPAEAAEIFSRLLEQTKSPTGEYSEEQRNNRALFQQHLASAYQDMGENEKAVAIYEVLVKEDPENSRHLFLLINAYRVNHQTEKALALAKEHFERNPKDIQIGLVYARTLGDAGKHNQGAEILHKLLQLDASNLDIYMNLSQIYLQGKRFSDAEKVLRRAQTLESLREGDTERIKFQLASLYERQKDFDRAESLFKEILKTNPDNASALNYMGYMLADRGVRLQEAVEYVEKALALEPNNGAYLDSLGWAFFKLNDLKQAETYLLKAVSIVKNDPTIHDHLGDLYFKSGDYRKAEEYWNRSLTSGTEAEEIQKVREKMEKLKETSRKQKRPE